MNGFSRRDALCYLVALAASPLVVSAAEGRDSTYPDRNRTIPPRRVNDASGEPRLYIVDGWVVSADDLVRARRG